MFSLKNYLVIPRYKKSKQNTEATILAILVGTCVKDSEKSLK